MTKKYKNAFSVVAATIWDSTILTLADEAYRKSVRHMIEWGMTARGTMSLALGHLRGCLTAFTYH